MISYSQSTLVQNYSPPPKKMEKSEKQDVLRCGRVVSEKQKLSEAHQAIRDQRLIALWKTSATAEQIALELGFSTRQGVYSAAYRLNLPRRKIPRPYKIRDAEADKVIIEMWPQKNFQLKDIAERLGWKYSQCVGQRARELGLPNRRNGQVREGA